MEDLSLPDDLGEILTQQLLKTTSHKGDEFDYDCEFDEEFDRLASQLCDGFGLLEQCSSEQAGKVCGRLEVTESNLQSQNRMPMLINYDAKAFLPIP